MYLSAGSLTSLDLSHNRITALPRELYRLRFLERLDLSHNLLDALPPCDDMGRHT